MMKMNMRLDYNQKRYLTMDLNSLFDPVSWRVFVFNP